MKRITLLLLICALALTLWGCPALDKDDPAPSGNLTVHYIDVGQADCALVECNGEYILIDGGNVADSQLVVSYLEKQGVSELLAVVCTHAHEDHVGGLAGVLAVYRTYHVYAPTRTYSSDCFDDFAYYTDQQDLEITIPEPGDYLSFGGATMTVLGPVKSYANVNDTSLVVRIDYGATRFLFTGDMEMQAENDMLDHWGENYDWRVDVLKVGHHGSSTSSGYRFLYESDPDYAIISVGADNPYGHPHEEPVSRFHDAGIWVYRTDELGSIVVTSDGNGLSFAWEKPTGAPTAPSGEVCYIGNKNSKVLHLPSCGGLPAEHNRVIFYDYAQALADGYTPCSGCME